jgi:hypothetical protein
LLVLHAALGVDTARRLTVTHDEYWHLPAGFLAWKTGRFDFDPLNPPLTRLWATWPLLFTHATCDSGNIPAGDLFALGRQFLMDNLGNYEFYLGLARSMNVAWSVLTGLLLALWSREFFNDKTACLTAALWAFCPTALANAPLVTPDAGGCCLFIATLYAAWRFARRPDVRTAGLAGLLLGLAQLAKFTNLLLIPLVIVVWWLAREPTRTDPPIPWRRRLGPWLAIGAISLLVLNLGYLFQGTFTRWNAYQFQSRSMQDLTKWAGSLTQAPLPLPREYLIGLDRQRAIMESQHPVYLDGKWGLDGFPDYYPRAMEYKLPHAVQMLGLLAVVFLVLPGREPRLLRLQSLILVPPAFVIVVASTIGMQLGIRYVLPALPPLYLFAGQTARWFDWQRSRLRALLVGVLALALPLSVRYHPHHLAYFNELAGGPIGGRMHLLDSNLDWGQDLRELKRYLDEQKIDDVGLAYFGMYPPSKLGIRYHVPPREPAPGWYAVSANFLYGRPHTIFGPDDTFRPADFGEFAWLRLFPPVARIGCSIDVFHVTDDDLRALQRQIGP